jgi:tRNA threonylcarbamoyladenosine biosynthesis protein TsaE
MVTHISKSPEQTLALGEQWGHAAQRGWVIGLSGDLGVGKTQFVKGLARGLGSPARVHSPSFALLNEYPGGRLPLFHIDLYRLNSPEEVVAAGLEEYLNRPNGVAVVEWIERWLPGASDTARKTDRAAQGGSMHFIHLEPVSESERRIRYDDPCN